MQLKYNLTIEFRDRSRDDEVYEGVSFTLDDRFLTVDLEENLVHRYPIDVVHMITEEYIGFEGDKK